MLEKIRYELWSHRGGTKEYEVAILTFTEGGNGTYGLVRRWGGVGRQKSDKFKQFSTLSHLNNYLAKVRNDKLRPLQDNGKGGYQSAIDQHREWKPDIDSHDDFMQRVTENPSMAMMVGSVPDSLLLDDGSRRTPPDPSPIIPDPEPTPVQQPSHYGTW